ncbi:MAG: tetratricopeptide repeat protein, partial [Proteobacteria bacterium]|nr:tetratricopeptide repeat protein [Pseudomonadota bacterium]
MIARERRFVIFVHGRRCVEHRQRPRRASVCCTFFLATFVDWVLATGPSDVHAQPPTPLSSPASVCSQDDPAPETYARANALFEDGNRALADGLFKRAVTLYRQALTHWDHAFVRYNLALALLELGQPIAAHANITHALRCPDDLGQDRHEQARSYQRMLERQLARIEVTCTEPGANVRLDGALVVQCPGRRTQLIAPGPHQLVASKRGHRDRVETLSLPPGAERSARITIDPIPPPAPAQPQRRWAQWKPWVVVAAGGLVAGAGGVMHWRSSAEFSRADSVLQGLECSGRSAGEGVVDGCTAAERDNDVDLYRNRGLWQQRL